MAAISTLNGLVRTDTDAVRQAAAGTSAGPMRHIAIWDQHNQHLAPSFIEKIARVVFWPLYKLAMLIALPATVRYSKAATGHLNAEFKSSIQQIAGVGVCKFHLKDVEISTPDGVKLKGSFIQNTECDANAPLVIFMQPNAAIYSNNCFNDFLDYAAITGKKCNFLFFDYRGCGVSEGNPVKAKDLIIDGDSVYQFARDHLHVPAQDIHMVGYSFGGGVSAQVKAIRQECTGTYVNDRSFSDIAQAAYELAGGGIIGTIAKVFMKILGWGALDSSQALKKISSPTMITYHHQDQIIKPSAQLKSSPSQTHIQSINLSVSKFTNPFYFHGLALSEFQLENGENAFDVTGNFIFRGIDEMANWDKFLHHLRYNTSFRRAQLLQNDIVTFIQAQQFLDAELSQHDVEQALFDEGEHLLTEEQKSIIVKKFYTRLKAIY